MICIACNSRFFYSSRPIKPYRFQADLLWSDGTFKWSAEEISQLAKVLSEVQRRLFKVLLKRLLIHITCSRNNRRIVALIITKFSVWSCKKNVLCHQNAARTCASSYTPFSPSPVISSLNSSPHPDGSLSLPSKGTGRGWGGDSRFSLGQIRGPTDLIRNLSSKSSCFFFYVTKKPVLRIRIQDPVLFWPLDPGWVKKPDPGWTSQIIFPRRKQFFG